MLPSYTLKILKMANVMLYAKVLVAQLCLTLCNPMIYSPPGSSVHGIFQARILEWLTISFSSGSSQPRDKTRLSCTAGRFFTDWATREAPVCYVYFTTIFFLNKYSTRSHNAHFWLSPMPHTNHDSIGICCQSWDHWKHPKNPWNCLYWVTLTNLL